jgi:hypothetical protein
MTPPPHAYFAAGDTSVGFTPNSLAAFRPSPEGLLILLIEHESLAIHNSKGPSMLSDFYIRSPFAGAGDEG